MTTQIREIIVKLSPYWNRHITPDEIMAISKEFREAEDKS